MKTAYDFLNEIDPQEADLQPLETVIETSLLTLEHAPREAMLEALTIGLHAANHRGEGVTPQNLVGALLMLGIRYIHQHIKENPK